MPATLPDVIADAPIPTSLAPAPDPAPPAPEPAPPAATPDPAPSSEEPKSIMDALFPKPKATETPDPAPDPAPAPVDGDDDTPPPSHFNKKDAEAWKHKTQQLREAKRRAKEAETQIAELDAVRKQYAEAQAALESLKNQPASTTKELEDLRAKYEEAQKELYVGRLEGTELYKSEVARPRQALTESIEQLAKDNEIAVEDIYRALNAKTSKERAKALSEIGASLTEFEKSKLFQTADHLAAVDARAETLRAEAKERTEALAAEQAKATETKATVSTEAWQKAAGSSWAKLETICPLLVPEEGNEAWNSQLQTVKDFAVNARFEDFATDTQAEIMVRAGALPNVVGLLNNAMKQVSFWREKFEKSSSKTPGSGTQPEPTPPVDERPASLVEAIKLARR